MATVEQIDTWLAAPSETAQLEFKEAKVQFSLDKLFEYCVAIANEGGGHLLLGITDKQPRRVVGSEAFQNPEAVTTQVLNKVGFHVGISVVHHPDGRVVVVEIPSRALGTAFALDGRYLMRSGESLVAMTEDRLRSIFQEGQPEWLAEPALIDVSGQQVIDRLDTQSFFELMREPFPTSSAAILDRLVRERLLVRKGSNFDLLRIAAILFARDLCDFHDLRRKAARVVVYEELSKANTRLDETVYRGYASGFRDLVRLVVSQLPQREIFEGSIRQGIKLLPDVSVRELIANALVHQDFSMTGTSVLVEIYPNRIEISNPGIPIVDVGRFIDSYQSRNEQLADLMRRMGICEELGSGVDKVVREAEFAQLPAPDFRQGDRRTSVILYGPKSFDDMDRNDRIRACYQHAALKFISNEYMTNQTLRERFGLPNESSKTVMVSQIIKYATEAGLIKRDPSAGTGARDRRYLPFWA